MPRYQVIQGDCREVLKTLADSSIDSVITDPPYELGFMGKGWDRSGIAYDVEVWRECLRVLKPGGHLLAFGGSRTYHRLACAIEDAGFEIRDDIDFWYDANPIFAEFYDSLTEAQKEMLHASAGAPHLSWGYGSGFPKSLDVSKAIDAAAGVAREVVGQGAFASRRPNGIGSSVAHGEYTTEAGHPLTAPATEAAKQWSGWGTALKPAHEPIVLARKPPIGTVAENVLQHGTGGLNINGCRIDAPDGIDGGRDFEAVPLDIKARAATGIYGDQTARIYKPNDQGRWPANVIHDGSEEVLAVFPETTSGSLSPYIENHQNASSFQMSREKTFTSEANSGSAARFFYCAKASKSDREDGLDFLPLRSAGRTNGSRNHHPTVKPTGLTRYLCRLITPPKGTVLDPFCGSGSTGRGAMIEKFNFIGIDLSAEYCEIAKLRIEAAIELQGSLFDQD